MTGQVHISLDVRDCDLMKLLILVSREWRHCRNSEFVPFKAVSGQIPLTGLASRSSAVEPPSARRQYAHQFTDTVTSPAMHCRQYTRQ
jgi:hypothetical protein